MVILAFLPSAKLRNEGACKCSHLQGHTWGRRVSQWKQLVEEKGREWGAPKNRAHLKGAAVTARASDGQV